MKSLNRIDRECEEQENYNWRDCLDEMFYLKKGCQDPWNVNPKVPLRICTNISEIRRSYRQGQYVMIKEVEWDQVFWDRPWMFERQVTELIRDGKRCKTPCSQTHFDVKRKSTARKDKYKSND